MAVRANKQSTYLDVYDFYLYRYKTLIKTLEPEAKTES